MEKYKVDINSEGQVFINEDLINEDIFGKEKVDYILREREVLIDDLYIWIGEATGSDKRNDLYMMKEDLKYLESLEDEFVFSSISTNEYIAKSDNLKEFNLICKKVLDLNKKE